MALSLAARGDSADKDEEITQEIMQESEDETIGLVIHDEDADPAGNDAAAIPVSASSNGNGSTAPVFKPGAEPQPGQELKPGEEPESGEAPKPSVETKPSAGPQSGTGSQSATPRPSTAPQSGATSQPGTGSQQSQSSQTGTASQSGTGSQPTGQSAATPQPTHTHTWVTNTVHHDATGHYESRVVGTEQVPTGQYKQKLVIVCRTCQAQFNTQDEWSSHVQANQHNIAPGSTYVDGDPIYETRDITENVWVQDSAAWDETVTTCSGCGARQ